MVGHEVTVYSKSATPGETGHKWTSDGTGKYSISEANNVRPDPSDVVLDRFDAVLDRFAQLSSPAPRAMRCAILFALLIGCCLMLEIRWCARIPGPVQVTRGTKIVITLNDRGADYAKELTVQDVLEKHSNFVGFPVHLNGTATSTGFCFGGLKWFAGSSPFRTICMHALCGTLHVCPC